MTTADFGLACYLVTVGHQVLNTQRQGTRMFFQFDDTGFDVDSDVREYRLGEASVPARKFLEAQRSIKSLIYADTP